MGNVFFHFEYIRVQTIRFSILFTNQVYAKLHIIDYISDDHYVHCIFVF